MPVKEPKVPAEAPGAGLNSCTYFVTHDLAEPFVKLPDVTPAQVELFLFALRGGGRHVRTHGTKILVCPNGRRTKDPHPREWAAHARRLT